MARGSVAALTATATAAASHTLAGAEAPSLAILALAIAFSAVVCVLLSGRRLSLTRLAVSVLLSQLAYHGLFLMTGGSGDVSVAGSTSTGAHFHDGGTVELIAAGGGHAAHSPGMLGAHLIAAVLTIAALRRGERLFWTLGAGLLRAVVRIVARASALLAPASPSIALVGTPEPRAPRALDAVLSLLRHRGPPARALLAA
ncbi:hypothetical protein GRS96_17385 [Rathayibacter sp. VKM Ac-2803]|uniref:hypothetical protein n=1 Tax=unclassified Rathayibacter TaxID=2609250 RepID=UPI0013567AF8|nr:MULTISPECIES: hypothetical protein [unclassified Rathayibacter]MWV51045.1 hypothetical protein [Rathayibacter sp. VKM Ac-2803]MWV57532.1 hypothetical protein [Rathayibacter sp. VKM Ac-2754]